MWKVKDTFTIYSDTPVICDKVGNKFEGDKFERYKYNCIQATGEEGDGGFDMEMLDQVRASGNAEILVNAVETRRIFQGIDEKNTRYIGSVLIQPTGEADEAECQLIDTKNSFMPGIEPDIDTILYCK